MSIRRWKNESATTIGVRVLVIAKEVRLGPDGKPQEVEFVSKTTLRRLAPGEVVEAPDDERCVVAWQIDEKENDDGSFTFGADHAKPLVGVLLDDGLAPEPVIDPLGAPELALGKG